MKSRVLPAVVLLGALLAAPNHAEASIVERVVAVVGERPILLSELRQRARPHLIRIAATRGRQTRNSLKLGICGEHGGDPDSIRFCHDTGLDYVSCSPFRVPVARLAAAQAALAERKRKS